MIPASGCFGFGREFSEIYDLSLLGSIMIKAVTREPRTGNAMPRIAETPAGMLNAIGLQNPGIDRVEEELRWLAQYDLPIIANVAGYSDEDYCYVAERISKVPNIGGLEINISCPNVKQGGITYGQDPEIARQLTRKIKAAASKPVYMKLSPNVANIKEMAQAVEDGGADGITMIGDSVALRSSDQLQQILPGIELDTVVSRSLSTGLEVYKTDIANRVLKKQVVLALGTNSSGYSNELLDEYVSSLPKGHQLILVTPYDGRSEGGVLAQQREYELELAKKYDYVFVADWHQTAIENPQIWEGTDYVHFGSNSESMIEGGTLYANTIKQAIDEANSGNVKP